MGYGIFAGKECILPVKKTSPVLEYLKLMYPKFYQDVVDAKLERLFYGKLKLSLFIDDTLNIPHPIDRVEAQIVDWYLAEGSIVQTRNRFRKVKVGPNYKEIGYIRIY